MKKILFINGSPRGTGSTSRLYAESIASRLPEGFEFEVIDTGRGTGPAVDFGDYRALVFIFPLYVDGLPGALTGWMERCTSEELPAEKPQVWALVNSGFIEGRQNSHALEVLGNFCRRTGLCWRGGIGIGAGAMIRMVQHNPSRSGMMREVLETLDEFAAELSGSQDMKSPAEPVYRFVQCRMPWWMYRVGGQMGWRHSLRQNGLKSREIGARPYAP